MNDGVDGVFDFEEYDEKELKLIKNSSNGARANDRYLSNLP